MNTLIIDNGTVRLPQIIDLMPKHEITITNPAIVENHYPENYELIILTGSSLYPIYGHQNFYNEEINLIKSVNTPIIGICLGFELICHTYGGVLERIDEKVNGLTEITFDSNYDYFQNLPNFLVYESHKWIVKDLPDLLIPIAHSKNGIEIIKHRDRQIWGFQFHPEMLVEQSCGDEIFQTVLNTL